MDELIQSIYFALRSGDSLEKIHEACVTERGWSEEDFFLAYKGAEILARDSKEFKEARQKRAVFKRSV